MGKKIVLTRAAAAKVQGAVDRLFDRIRERYLEQPPVDKKVVFGLKGSISLPDLYRMAAGEEGVRPDAEVLAGLVRVASSYLDAQQARTKARVVHAVEAWMNDISNRGGEPDVERILAGELSDAFGEAKVGVKRIFDTETTRARNTGLLDGIVRVNAGMGIDDPVVYFALAHYVDEDAPCEECRRLHMMPDGVTPRLWHLSEVGHGYHKEGDDNPKLGGLHPHCRCVLVTLMPDYGFDAAGTLRWIGFGHDALKAQREAKP